MKIRDIFIDEEGGIGFIPGILFVLLLGFLFSYNGSGDSLSCDEDIQSCINP